MEGLTKIAEYYQGCDRDNGIHTDIEFYENQEGLVLFRYVHQIWQGHLAEEKWKTRTSDFKPYKGVMTKQEIIDHPDWALNCEQLAIKERDCAMNLEKIAETQAYKFKAFKGPASRKTEYFECRCCGQNYFRERWHLEETGACIIDSGYEPEINLTKEEIIANAPEHDGLGRLRRSDLVARIKK